MSSSPRPSSTRLAVPTVAPSMVARAWRAARAWQARGVVAKLGAWVRHHRRAVIAAVAVAACVALALGVIYPKVGAWYIRNRALPRLERQLGVKVQVADLEVSLGRAVLHGVVIDDGTGHLEIGRATIDIGTLRSLVGSVEVQAVHLAQVEGALVEAGPGALSVGRWRSGRAGGDDTRGRSGSLRGGLRPARMTVRGVQLRLLAAEGPDAELTVARAQFEVAARRAALTDVAVARGGQRLTAASVDVDVRQRRATFTGGAWVTARAQVHGAGTLRPDGAGGVQVEAAGTLGLGGTTAWTVLGGWQPGLDPHAAVHTGGRTLELSLRGDELGFAGELALEDVGFAHPAIADDPIRDVDVHATVRGRVALRARRLELSAAEVRLGQATVRGQGAVQVAGGAASVDLAIDVPAQPCQQVLEAIPQPLREGTQGYRLGGEFAFTTHLVLDSRNLDATQWTGTGGLGGCTIEAAPADGVERLRGNFRLTLAEGKATRDGRTALEIKRGGRDFVNVANVAQYVIDSVVTTEDPTFYEHAGFDPRGFRRALVENLKAGGFVLGSSSISMQVVKNVLLGGHRTLGRKLGELVLAWHLEQVLRKDRILEVYLNVIEFGPGIYGLKSAAEHFFALDPADLGPREAAFFSAIIPAPTFAYRYYCRSQFDGWMKQRVRRALGLILANGKLPKEEWELATATYLQFREPDEDRAACEARSVRRP